MAPTFSGVGLVTDGLGNKHIARVSAYRANPAHPHLKLAYLAAAEVDPKSPPPVRGGVCQYLSRQVLPSRRDLLLPGWRRTDKAHEVRELEGCAGVSHRAGTKHVVRVEENTTADGIELSAGHTETLNLTPAVGEHHNQEQMAMYER